MDIITQIANAIDEFIKMWGRSPTTVYLDDPPWSDLVNHQGAVKMLSPTTTAYAVNGIPVVRHIWTTGITCVGGPHVYQAHYIPPAPQPTPTQLTASQKQAQAPTISGAALALKNLMKAVDKANAAKQQTSAVREPVCECGADKTGCGGHSTWCPKFGALKAA